MNIRTSAFRGLAILSLTALGMAACEDKDVINIPETPAPAVEVTVAPTQVSIAVGQTATAAAVVKNATNQAVTWSSGDATVASVTSAGVITGVKAGSTVITATSAADATAKGLVAVTVTAPVITMSLLPTTATINSVAPGNTIQLAATVSGSSNQTVTWTTSAAGVATVAAGLVTAVAPGTAVITATSAADANVKASSVITVVAPPVTPVAITLQPATANTTIGGTVQMVAIVTGSTNTAVTYASSDATVATVSAAGLVTGVKGGTAVITATAAADATKKATAVITVAGAPPAASISIASVVQHNEGAPVDPNNIENQIDVTVNVSAVPENGVRAVVVYVDDLQVCRQNFSTPLGTTQGVATINCPVNTAEVLMPGYDPKFMNGEHEISAKALTEAGGIITTATFCPIGAPCKVLFDNHDFVAKVTASFEHTVGDWHAGVVTAHVELVKYSLTNIDEFVAAFYEDCDNSSAYPNNGDAKFFGDVETFDLTYADGEWVGETGADDETFDAACVGVGYLEYEGGDHFWSHVASPEFQYDTEAPYIDELSGPTSNLYYNDGVTFTADVDDDGVGGEDALTVLEIQGQMTKTGPAGTASITTADLTETPLNKGYKLYVYVNDALGNSATYGSYGDFGIDFTEPQVEFTWTQDYDPIDSGLTFNELTDAINFHADYIDEATPPAGPAGFSDNPFSCTKQWYGSSSSSATTTQDSDYELPATTTNGYYIVNCKVTDAAGNFVNMDPFTVLVDNVQPNAGNLTVPSVLTGGAAYTLSAAVTDNIDLGTGWATIGYYNIADILGYWIVQNETTFGTYGLPLTKTTTYGTLTIDKVIRTVRTVDATTNLAANGLVYTAARAEYALRDVAGVQLEDNCPLANVALVDGATTANCMIRLQDIIPGYNAGNPTGAVSSWTITNAIGSPTAAGFAMDASTTKIDAIITGTYQIFANPFTKVYFYWVDQSNRAHLIAGDATVGVTDNTITQIRTWRYTIAASWPDDVNVTKVFALVVNSSGDALVTQAEPNPVIAP